MISLSNAMKTAGQSTIGDEPQDAALPLSSDGTDAKNAPPGDARASIAPSPAQHIVDSHAMLRHPVLIISPWYRPIIGGVVEVADRLLTDIRKAGNDAHLMVCGELRGAPIRPDPGRQNVWTFGIPCGMFYKPSPRSLAATVLFGLPAVWRLWGFIRRHKVRTAILLYPIAYAWPLLLMRRLTGLRLIASCHGNDIVKYHKRTLLGRWLFRRVLKASTAITLCAAHLREPLGGIDPRCLRKVHVITNCVDPLRFAPRSAPPPGQASALTFVHVSNFAPKKRTCDIVDAFAKAQLAPPAHLIMVGGGVEFETAVRTAARLGVADRVDFVGPVSDVRPFLWKSDVFVLASDEEGSPLALGEAMACGLPWISTDWGDMVAIIPPNLCGLLVPRRDIPQMAQAMQTLCRDEQLRKRFGANARNYAQEHFSPDRYLQRHLYLISMVESRPMAR
jgi:glycosyltransferase involved in cell wall biosynthesis